VIYAGDDIKNVKVVILLCLSLGFCIWSYRWYANYTKMESHQDGLVPFQAVIYDQHQQSYKSNFVAVHSGKHLIVFSYVNENKNPINQPVMAQQNTFSGQELLKPNFSWFIKSGKKTVQSGEGNSAQVSGTRELLLGTVELKSGETYSFEATLQPSFISLLPKLPEISVIVESKSPEFMIGIYRQYGLGVSVCFALLALITSGIAVIQIRKLRRQSLAMQIPS
jgi:hypothetical protein